MLSWLRITGTDVVVVIVVSVAVDDDDDDDDDDAIDNDVGASTAQRER